MKEVWKDIRAYEGCYQVSSLGQVRRLDTQIPFPKRGLQTRKGRLMKSTRNSKGYPTIVLCWKSKRKTFSVHALVADAFVIKVPGLTNVNHIDGKACNNSLCNLERVTPSYNQFHAYEKGLKGHGENNGNAKLSENDVKLIKKLLLLPRTCSDHKLHKKIAEKFSVSVSSIKWIDKGRTWRRVTVND